jgi:hypothetical protein
MKFIAIIFVTYISVLTIQPLATTFYSYMTEQECESFCDDTCCKDEQASDKQDENNCCPNGVCNPFEQCNCCVGVTISHNCFQPIEMMLYTNFIQPIATDINSNYSADCFRPPKTV